MSDSAKSLLRVAIQQTALPRYRLPVFRLLAATQGKRLTLHYGSEEPALMNVEPDGFDGVFEPFITLPKIAGQTFFWHSTQWRLASPQNTDVAIMGWNTRYLSLLPALVRARISGVPVGLWGHGFSKRPSRWRSWVRNIPARLASAVIVYDAHTAEQLVAGGLAAHKVFVAPNGLDSIAIQKSRQQALASHDRIGWRRAKGLGEGPVLIFLGRLFADNRLDLAIAALPALAARFPDLRLVIVGNGADEQARLHAQADELGVAHHLHWVGPVYDEAELAPWLIAADLFVYPSNVGLSLIHAFNYALPAVVCAPRSAHNPEIVALADGVNGRLAPEPDAQALATSITELLTDDQARQAMGEAALQCVLQTYNLHAMVAGFNNLIDYLNTQRRAQSQGPTSTGAKSP